MRADRNIGQVIGHQIRTEHVTLVDGGPQLPRPGAEIEAIGVAQARSEDTLATGLEIDFPDQRAAFFDLEPVLAEIEGLTAPESIVRLWNGGGQAGSLKQDVLEVVTLANRLDLFADYSLPAAQRVFTQMQTIASERVRPNLDSITAELRADTIKGYGWLEKILYAVAGVIFLVSVGTTLWVFVPMMRNIAKAHDDLREANASSLSSAPASSKASA